MAFHERHNRYPEKSPRDLSFKNLESSNEVLDLDAQFARHFIQMASAIIPRTLHQLLETVKNLGELPMLAVLWKEKAGEVNRFYNRLKVQFDYTSDIVSELNEDLTSLRILALHEKIKSMAPEIALLATWAEDLGNALVAGLERSSNSQLEEYGEGYDEEESAGEEETSVGDFSTIAQGVRKRLLNVAADMRAQMAMLSSGTEEHSSSTVADLVAAFSNSVVFVDALPSSEVISTDGDAASLAIHLVVSAMVRGHSEVTELPDLTPQELVAVLSSDSEAFARESRLEQMQELLLAVVPLMMSPTPGGKVRLSFALPEVALSLWQPAMDQFVERLKRLSSLVQILGGSLVQGSRIIDGNVEVFCELKLPGEILSCAQVSDDTSVITARDRTALEGAHSPNYVRPLRLRVRHGAGEAEVSIEMLSAAFSTDEGRSCVSRALPIAVQLAMDLGGRTISMAPEEGCSSLLEAFATGRFKVVIQGKLHNVQGNEDTSEASRNFGASHRFLRRWDDLHSLAGEFSETSRYVSPFIALSAQQLENRRLLDDIRALGKRANVVLFDLAEVASDQKRLVEAVSRARKAIESLLDNAPCDKRLNLAVNSTDPYSAEPPVIEFVCTDEQHAPLAAGRVGIVHGFEETSTFPLEDMSYLASSVCEVLWELWPARKLTVETFQGELRKQGCELSSSFVARFVDTQLRKEQPLSMYEVNALVLQALLSDRDAFVISSESNGYRISLLSRIERLYRYGTGQ